MGISDKTEKAVLRVRWYDCSILKAATFFFTLFLLTIWPGLHDFVMSIEWYWYLLITIVIVSPIIKKVFTKL